MINDRSIRKDVIFAPERRSKSRRAMKILVHDLEYSLFCILLGNANLQRGKRPFLFRNCFQILGVDVLLDSSLQPSPGSESLVNELWRGHDSSR
jgi:hypothetical protein